jgi:O-antigen/teichoic acid export membrane protein
MIPLSIIMFLFGGEILGLIGKSYEEGGVELLKVLSASTIFIAFFQIFFSNIRVKEMIKETILISLLNFVMLLTTSYIFLMYFGLTGVGFAFIISYGLCGLISWWFLRR